MKSVLFAALSLVSISAQAAPVPGAALETIQVVKIERFANLMPPRPKNAGARLTVTFKALSGGCTVAEDFSLVSTTRENTDYVTVVRDKVDTCEMPAVYKTFQVSGRSGVRTNIVIKNPLRVDNNFAH